MQKIILLLMLVVFEQAFAQVRVDKFKQMDEEWPTPNNYRNAAGAPSYQYWQQKADYVINVELDDDNQRIMGEETITYTNNSPDALSYLWLQLDQNIFAPNSDAQITRTEAISARVDAGTLQRWNTSFDGGYKIEFVKDKNNKNLPFTINKTMMRVDLPVSLKSKESFVFKIKWSYNINDGLTTNARTGYEFFPEDKNYAYHIAQFYPRMAVYSDVQGWQHKQFLGRGEFTLSFGDFQLNITAPDDHIIAATGELQNANEILTAAQRERLAQAKTANKPIFIQTQTEAVEKEKTQSKNKKTWRFKAQNVRDVAFASSRKFIWDAQGVAMSDGRTVMAMSFYPKEGNPLWEKYSTAAIIHTLKTYGKYTFEYPYPVAISTHAAFTGMEYPMICFNFGRPRADGTYPEQTKYRMIGVIIHEVGHNWFPMIVNSDERQWSWLDEGLNSFLEYLTEVEWERDYPVRRGTTLSMIDYMKGDKNGQEPIMTNSESITQFGNNAYGKPATALNILRETVMGRELFDFAFKEYANRWKFKHPTPADFFRTMEDASAVDLDWFWRGWFYSTDHVDISISNFKQFKINSLDQTSELQIQKLLDANNPIYISDLRNQTTVKQTVMEAQPELKDEFNNRDAYRNNPNLDKQNEKKLSTLTEADKKLFDNKNYYELNFKNIGGLVMPIILQFVYEDGSNETKYIPAEVWRYDTENIRKVFITEKTIKEVILDPYLETADTDRSNNYFPPRAEPSRFEMFRD
jgi:Peptidase family M1 domain